MRKYPLAAAAMAAMIIPGGAALAQPAACRGTALLVSVSGFKERAGTLRVQTYAGAANYADGHRRVSRIEVPVPRGSGPVDVCVPLPGAGDYAVSIRHDANGDGRSDRGDGGGFSNNPRLSLGQAISRRNPSYDSVRVDAGAGRVTPVPITLNYLRGLSIGPIRRNP
ncbi:uncharacterized protein (DUF2141 family) [Sphingomonas jejuensis]|uniref:Uncharacterized protein (DUF2141 family) n=1 Tax=Sphingomonas jejuensis TaxID=904715 RepID=A0ABX0XLG3_9SPHN|nr:DUF2141 domain-containing protein [Sphingomonas jejuensis]NJC34212.1 uncharacterized protein (DUF2141 family) [Sphingomonas jejuensis]